MPVDVDLFGIARARAGVARVSTTGDDLGDMLDQLARRFPALAESSIEGRHLRPGFTANLGGDRFVTAPETRLVEGAVVLILSVDAGG